MPLSGAVAMIVTGLVLGFAVTASPSWLSIGLLGSCLVISGLAALLIAVLGRISRARRERWHGAGPVLMAMGGTLWLAVHPPYIKGLDLLNLGFIIAVTGFVTTLAAAYVVSPWRGRNLAASWLNPPPVPDAEQTRVLPRASDDWPR